MGWNRGVWESADGVRRSKTETRPDCEGGLLRAFRARNDAAWLSEERRQEINFGAEA